MNGPSVPLTKNISNCAVKFEAEEDNRIVYRCLYRLETVDLKSFVSKVLLRIKWKFELTVHFKHEMLGK